MYDLYDDVIGSFVAKIGRYVNFSDKINEYSSLTTSRRNLSLWEIK